MQQLYNNSQRIKSNDKRLTSDGDISVLMSRNRIMFISNEYKADAVFLDDWKVVIPQAFNAQLIHLKAEVHGPGITVNMSRPLFPVASESDANNLKSYFGTTLVKFLLSLVQPSFKMQSPTFRLVPQVDLNQPWDDARTMKEFNLTQEEIDWMQSCIQDFDIHKNG